MTVPTPHATALGLLDVTGIAHYLSISPRMARRLVDERRVPIVKVGSLVRVRRDDLDSFVALNTIPSNPARARTGR